MELTAPFAAQLRKGKNKGWNLRNNRMKTYYRKEAVERMNQLAEADRAFVFIISYDGQRAYVEPADEVDSEELLYAFPGMENVPVGAVCKDVAVEWDFVPPSRESYERSINYVKKNQREGNSYLANLTCRVPVSTNLSMRDIFLRSKALYRCWVKGQFVCFSPEIFVRVKEGTISSYPMKGTIDATLPDAELALMENPKEAAEHATIVDLIRNDLSMVADHVHVDRYRYVDRLKTNKGEILQTSSEISGNLSAHYRSHVGELLFRLLPAGSITGAPKPKTVEIIAEAEGYDRGFYTGVMGYCADGVIDSAVMIRFIDLEDGQLYYKAGGGITAQSNNDDEYSEVIEKVYVPIY